MIDSAIICELKVAALRACGFLVCYHLVPLTALMRDRQTATGAAISAYLKGTCDLSDHAVHLLFAANRWEARQAIMDAIAAGADVVVDRYYYSGMVYSVAKGLPNLDLQWARAPEVGLPRPDLVFFLDLSAEAAAGRGQFGEEKYESVAMQGKVRSVFMEVIRSEGRGSGLTKIIDASAGIDEVAASICRVVDSLPDPKHALLCIA